MGTEDNNKKNKHDRLQANHQRQTIRGEDGKLLLVSGSRNKFSEVLQFVHVSW